METVMGQSARPNTPSGSPQKASDAASSVELRAAYAAWARTLEGIALILLAHVTFAVISRILLLQSFGTDVFAILGEPLIEASAYARFFFVLALLLAASRVRAAWQSASARVTATRAHLIVLVLYIAPKLTPFVLMLPSDGRGPLSAGLRALQGML